MINEPPIDELISKLGDKYQGSKYALCVVASKRARQLIDQTKTQASDAVLTGRKPLTAAAYDIHEDKVIVSNN